jgi:S-formylglutathione hydrolase
METVSESKSYGGTQGVYTHQAKTTDCEMTFAVFVPPQAKDAPCPVVWYLSGLTCTHQNVIDKGEYRRTAAELGLVIVCPDTSPRGDDIANEPDNWQIGTGAGFYVDATEEPWSAHYKMYSYVTRELPKLIAAEFPVDMDRQAIFGHSMGGHGALTTALNHPDRFLSCSAFAPIVAPSKAEWARNAFIKYLGDNEKIWRAHDACLLVEDGKMFPEFLIDQGDADPFLESGLMPQLFEEACRKSGIPLTLRMQQGYDHSYNFISTFMEDHLRWHAERLGVETAKRE